MADAGGGGGGEKGGGATSEYKEKKAEQLKAAANDSTNWNSLFIRPEAVGDAMAKRYGVSKSEFLDERTGGDGTSLAVKLAQGETHILQ